MINREFGTDSSPEEVAEFERRAADLASFGGITIVFARHPDKPDTLAASVDIGTNAPCYGAVARQLRVIAEEFEARHDTESPCARSAYERSDE